MVLSESSLLVDNITKKKFFFFFIIELKVQTEIGVDFILTPKIVICTYNIYISN